jgi:hypothetical protein
MYLASQSRRSAQVKPAAKAAEMKAEAAAKAEIKAEAIAGLMADSGPADRISPAEEVTHAHAEMDD